MNDLFSLHGRRVLLTGATGMLGRSYARTLHRAGAILTLVDVDQDSLEKLRNELLLTAGPLNDEILVGVCDFRDRRESDQVILPLIAPGIDILINNAALTGRSMKNMPPSGDLLTCPDDMWDAAMEVNITSMFRITKGVLKGMLQQGSGNIINISSIHGNVGPDPSLYEGLSISSSLPYSVSKAAVLNFTRYIANQYGGHGIRCNSLSLGGVQSDVTSPMFVQRYSARTALGRMALPTDYDGAMLFLCSEASAYMTGSNLVIDGGWTAR